MKKKLKIKSKVKIQKKQDGGGLFDKNKTAFVDSTLNANKNLEFVNRLYDKNPKTIQIPGEPYPSTHFMEYDSASARVYPTVVNQNGNLKYLGTGDPAWDYADSSKEYIQFPNSKQTEWFGSGYKQGTGVLPQHQNGGNISTMGYKDNSPYKDRESIVINSPNGLITMDGVSIPILANGKLLPPNSGLHQFNTDKIKEVPLKNIDMAKDGIKIKLKKKGDGGKMSFNIGSKNSPIIIHNPNDSRLKAYNDSLDLSNKGVNLVNYTGKDRLDKVNQLIYQGVQKNNTPFEYDSSSDFLRVPQYKRPIQPYQYKKQDQIDIVPTQNYQIPIDNKQSLETNIPQNNIQLLTTSGKIFSRPRQPGESGSSSFPDRVTPQVDYFDGKTGKPFDVFQQGGIIDQRGQWAHPGKITTILGNDITMQGVNYPVLGISDTGHTQMMQPGGNYKFKGNSVTEYPQQSIGKRQFGGNVQTSRWQIVNEMQNGGQLDEQMDDIPINHMPSINNVQNFGPPSPLRSFAPSSTAQTPPYIAPESKKPTTSNRLVRSIESTQDRWMRPIEDSAAANISRLQQSGVDLGNPHNGPYDAMRHAGSAMFLADKIKNSAPFNPVAGSIAGFLGSNLAGAAHEGLGIYQDLTNHRMPAWEETGMDLYNNLQGSLTGVSNTSLADKKNELYSKLVQNKYSVLQPLPITQKPVENIVNAVRTLSPPQSNNATPMQNLMNVPKKIDEQEVSKIRNLRMFLRTLSNKQNGGKVTSQWEIID